jgi:hypothetical protein
LTRIILIILNNFKINYIINIYNNRNRGGIRNNLTNLFNLIFLNTLIVYKQIFYTSPILLLVLFFKFTLITLLHNICGVHESIKYILLFSDIVGTLAKGPSIHFQGQVYFRYASFVLCLEWTCISFHSK